MSYKRCYVKCARIKPHLRECRFCRHTCALRMEKFVDFNEEHALIEHNEDMKELAQQEALENVS